MEENKFPAMSLRNRKLRVSYEYCIITVIFRYASNIFAYLNHLTGVFL